MTIDFRNTFKHGALAVAATLCLLGTANAQRSSGNITGNAVAGDTVIVQGANTGFHREITLEKDGRYRVGSVPTGAYTVTVKHADGSTDATKAVMVRVGSTARVQ